MTDLPFSPSQPAFNTGKNAPVFAGPIVRFQTMTSALAKAAGFLAFADASARGTCPDLSIRGEFLQASLQTDALRRFKEQPGGICDAIDGQGSPGVAVALGQSENPAARRAERTLSRKSGFA